MNQIVLKRAGAYLFDMLIVSVLALLLSYLPFINPNRTLYSEKYNELINVNEQYKNNEISKEEYEEAYIPISYDMYRLNTNYVIIDMIIVLLYFGIFPYFFEGQTIGKKLFQLRIVSANKNKLSVLNYLLRAIVLNNTLISLASLVVIYALDVNHYYPILNNINLVGYIVLYMTIFMVIVKKDHRGLQDYVGGTKVVSENLEKESHEENILVNELESKKAKVIEAKVKTKKKKKEDTN